MAARGDDGLVFKINYMKPFANLENSAKLSFGVVT
jgi:hypothetical protein